MKKLHVVILGLIFGLAGLSFAMQSDQISSAQEGILEPAATENPEPPTPPSNTGNPGSTGGTTTTTTNSSSAAPASTAGRIADLGSEGSVYLTNNTILLYRIGSDLKGFAALTVTAAEVAKFPEKPAQNTLIKRSADGKFAVYRLTTGELQINIGPNAEGNVYVRIFSGLDATTSYGYSFNVYDILGRS